MPRYMVERKFPNGMPIKPTVEGAAIAAKVVERNAALGVTWLHFYVNEEKTKTFCVYDAPDSEAVRKAAERNGLPVDGITKVQVLDPYFNR